MPTFASSLTFFGLMNNKIVKMQVAVLERVFQNVTSFILLFEIIVHIYNKYVSVLIYSSQNIH